MQYKNFSVKIWTDFDRGRRWYYRSYGRDTPLRGGNVGIFAPVINAVVPWQLTLGERYITKQDSQKHNFQLVFSEVSLS